MTNRYRVVAAPHGWPESLPFSVQNADGVYEIGDEFDHDFSDEDEAVNLASGLLEIVPRTYRVVGGSYVHDTAPGDTFEAALTAPIEALLVAGSHIERVDPEPPSNTEE